MSSQARQKTWSEHIRHLTTAVAVPHRSQVFMDRSAGMVTNAILSSLTFHSFATYSFEINEGDKLEVSVPYKGLSFKQRIGKYLC